MSSPDDLLSRAEICALLGVSRQTLYNWGMIPDETRYGTQLWFRSTVDRIARERGRA